MNDEKIENLIHEIAEENRLQIEGFSELSGGDINRVFLLKLSSDLKIVLKINDAEKFPGMFSAEKTGLEALAGSKTIDIPTAMATGKKGEFSYLLLEHKESGQQAPDFWQTFGKNLAALHKCTSEKFGFKENNYIGSLPQQNNWQPSASEFYINERLEPQLKIAKNNGYQLQVQDSFFKNISEIIPNEAPALLHGDLWNGNYLVNREGNPCLIDPAVAYGPREMDIGMMKLFGGFNGEVFKTYNSEFPLKDGFEERLSLWQLYYLLVHLNIFGLGYKNRVCKILKQYS